MINKSISSVHVLIATGLTLEAVSNKASAQEKLKEASECLSRVYFMAKNAGLLEVIK